MPSSGDWIDSLSDRAMAAGLRRGNRRAWERFYTTYGTPIYRFIYSRTGALDMAEDITHDTIIAAVEGIGRFKASRGTLWNWLCGIAVNKIREHQRQHVRDEQIRETLLKLPTLPGFAEDGMAEEEIFPVLATLHPRHQQVLILKYLESLDVSTIAVRLDCGAKAVESRLTRARDAFRREYRRHKAEEAVHD